MNEHFNKLTPAEAERLAILAEECGEVLQIVGKILRHGYESKHPDGGPTNRELLALELGDLQAIMTLIRQAYDVNSAQVHEHMLVKMFKITQEKKHIHHQ